MSDYLADVVLPPAPEPEPEPEPEPIDIPEEPTIALRDDPESEEDILPPEPVKKPKLKKEDIFKSKPSAQPLEVKEIVKPEPIKKPKRVLTEKQLEGLAKGRAKRAERAAANKAEKERIKAEKKQLRDQKEEAKEKRQEEKEARPPPPVKHVQESFTKKDLEEATFKAVEAYDNRRKARKIVKKKEQAKQNHEEKIFKDINSQLGNVAVNDPWDQCFKF